MKIMFRIVAVLLSLGVIAAAFFVPIFDGQVMALGMSLTEDFSIYEIIDLAIPDDGGEAAFNLSEFWQTLKKSADAIKPIIAPAICFVVFFVLALLIALATAIINIFKSMKKTTTFLGLAGLLSVIAAMISINAFEGPLVSGDVNIFSILDLSFLLSLATSLVEVKAFALGSGANLMLFAFAIIFLWGLSYIVIDLGDPKAQKNPSLKERKRK